MLNWCLRTQIYLVIFYLYIAAIILFEFENDTIVLTNEMNMHSGTMTLRLGVMDFFRLVLNSGIAALFPRMQTKAHQLWPYSLFYTVS